MKRDHRQLLRAITPRYMLVAYHWGKSHWQRQRSPRNVFTDIYTRNRWGGNPGEFFSGSGSRGTPAETYVAAILAFIARRAVTRVVDLGCGDFHIGRQIAPYCAHYTGVDVVPIVIESHQRTHGSDRINFVCGDITRDPLPDGELCLVRQVFQHLSNAQIAQAIKSLIKYRYVIVTEHYPSDADFQTANLDKVHGADTRLRLGSAVYLDQPPFNLGGLELVMEVPAADFAGAKDVYGRGWLRSYLWRPNA